MADPNDPCLACGIVAGEVQTLGGVVAREGGFTVHALAGPSPLPGWLVVTSDRHVRAIDGLDGAEAAALGLLAGRVMRAQRAALGAEHVYAFAIGDALHHAHLHLVPRYEATPSRLRGCGCFDARPEDRVADAALADAAERVRRALARS